MERRTQAGRRGFVTVHETLTTEVMEVSMSGKAGTFFAVGATARALRVTSDEEKRSLSIHSPSFVENLNQFTSLRIKLKKTKQTCLNLNSSNKNVKLLAQKDGERVH